LFLVCSKNFNLILTLCLLWVNREVS
jgi:hypothetical protein